MFPYKSNAFHAGYSTRKPIKLSKLIPLIAIAVLLGLFVYSEAKVGKTLPTSI
jgi:hypothetical protein